MYVLYIHQFTLSGEIPLRRYVIQTSKTSSLGCGNLGTRQDVTLGRLSCCDSSYQELGVGIARIHTASPSLPLRNATIFETLDFHHVPNLGRLWLGTSDLFPPCFLCLLVSPLGKTFKQLCTLGGGGSTEKSFHAWQIDADHK